MTPSNDTRASGEGEALLALAAKCEVASGPDRELDGAIGLVAGSAKMQLDGTWMTYHSDGYTHSLRPPAYTASVDAAMTLVPDNARLLALTEAMRVAGVPTIWFAKLAHADRKGGFPATQAATPALALTAAALRARYAAPAQEQHP